MSHLKIGELARRIGTTVRALHHYEALGLVVPRRSAGGYRLYDERDLGRLLQVSMLRQLGLSLADAGFEEDEALAA